MREIRSSGSVGVPMGNCRHYPEMDTNSFAGNIACLQRTNH
jgi:hypothetical protein